jgi:hypothetical protein
VKINPVVLEEMLLKEIENSEKKGHTFRHKSSNLSILCSGVLLK